jgi:rhamnulokinase
VRHDGEVVRSCLENVAL